MQLDANNTRTNHRQGESFVWLSAAGLGLALMMVLSLVGLVLFRGLSLFWPDPVAVINLADPDTGALTPPRTVAGTIVEKGFNEIARVEEWRLMTGNEEVLGARFSFINRNQILDTSYPDEIVLAERVASGPAIFFPIRLVTPEGGRAVAGEPGFWPLLRDSVAGMRQRFEAVQELESREIGPLNRRLSVLRQREHRLLEQAAGGTAVSAGQLEKLQRQEKALRMRIETLIAEVRELRTFLDLGELHYRIPSGEVRSQPLGDFLAVTRPNAMGLYQKTGHFVSAVGRFLSQPPREANTAGGIFPAIFGTLSMTLLMSIAVMPLGVVTALYLREYARQGLLVKLVRIGVNNLAGVPSIVYGVFGLGFFVYFIGGGIDQLFFPGKLPNATFGTGGILWAALTLALMTVPVVIVATEEALASVPQGVREASLACGASKWQTLQRIVLPSAAPGILTGLILAVARGAGAVAPLMLVGVVKMAPTVPIDSTFPFIHLDRKFMHLGFHIYDLGFQSPDSEATRPTVFATTLFLILLVVALNLGAVILRNRLRARFHSGTF
jgi:phosphate transport system permease protein